jgi:hypothetical protein
MKNRSEESRFEDGQEQVRGAVMSNNEQLKREPSTATGCGLRAEIVPRIAGHPVSAENGRGGRRTAFAS